MEFRLNVGLDGLRTVSRFDIDKLQCDDLKNEVYQMGVILYPPDNFNEKFLIKIRDCVVHLSENHPVKKWLHWVAQTPPPQELEKRKIDFITGVINSQFNLITDEKIKNQIVEHLSDIPMVTLAEKMLKSYLYLMIGNITRSNNILRAIIQDPPVHNWLGFSSHQSVYHQLTMENADKILGKLAGHPTERGSYELFSFYLSEFFNDAFLNEAIKKHKLDELEGKLQLAYTQKLAPSLVHYLRLKKMDETRRIKHLRDTNAYPLREQAYWEWGFFDIDPLVSSIMFDELKELEKEDELWFIYLLNNEKLSDLYIKNGGKVLLPSRRTYLRNKLKEKQSFMLTLYKLIEIGDIDGLLVLETIQFLTHE